jgi:hypothetical protein
MKVEACKWWKVEKVVEKSWAVWCLHAKYTHAELAEDYICQIPTAAKGKGDRSSAIVTAPETSLYTVSGTDLGVYCVSLYRAEGVADCVSFAHGRSWRLLVKAVVKWSRTWGEWAYGFASVCSSYWTDGITATMSALVVVKLVKCGMLLAGRDWC